MKQINVHNEQSKKDAIDYIASLDTDKFYRIKITQKRGKRSISQNSLYWMWLTCIEQETGNDKNELHEFFKNEILGRKCLYIGDYESLVTVSTTELNTAQFKQYLDKIQIFANTELSIILPNPEDKHFEEFANYYSKFI